MVRVSARIHILSVALTPVSAPCTLKVDLIPRVQALLALFLSARTIEKYCSYKYYEFDNLGAWYNLEGGVELRQLRAVEHILDLLGAVAI